MQQKVPSIVNAARKGSIRRFTFILHHYLNVSYCVSICLVLKLAQVEQRLTSFFNSRVIKTQAIMYSYYEPIFYVSLVFVVINVLGFAYKST